MSGETVTWTTGAEPLPAFTITPFSGANPQAAARLRDALLKVRPVGHDYLCDEEFDAPDRWIEEEEDPWVEGTQMQAVEWKRGVGLVCTGEVAEKRAPYAGWCCEKARQRQEIDAALKATDG